MKTISRVLIFVILLGEYNYGGCCECCTKLCKRICGVKKKNDESNTQNKLGQGGKGRNEGPNTQKKFGVCGIKNLGSTCAKSSALACLFHCPELKDYFLNPENLWKKDLNKRDKIAYEFVNEYYNLLKEYWSGDKTYVDPTELNEILNNSFLDQEDKTDFYASIQKCLDLLDSGLSRNKTGKKRKSPQKTLQEKLCHAQWSEYLKDKENNSIIEEVFYGVVKPTTHYDFCNEDDENYDIFRAYDLTIPDKNYVGVHIQQQKKIIPVCAVQIEKGETIKTILDKIKDKYPDLKTERELSEENLKFFEISGKGIIKDLELDDQYQKTDILSKLYCLQKKSNLFKKENFVVPNKVNYKENELSIEDCFDFHMQENYVGDAKCPHCKNGISPCRRKTGHFFYLPQILIIRLMRLYNEKEDLKKKKHTKINFDIDNVDLSKFVSGPEKGKNIYECFAVCKHHGDTTAWGHYTAVCKNVDGNWYKYNDSICTEIPEKNVIKEVVSPETYVIFLRRKDATQNNAGILNPEQDINIIKNT